MNRVNKILFHVGMIAAISGMLSCYASESAPNEVPSASDPSDVICIWRTLRGSWQKDFLIRNQKEWVPYLFKTLPENTRRYVLDQHKVELRQEQIREGKGPANVTKLTDAAQRLLGDIQVEHVDPYTVRLSRPLPELSAPKDYEGIICYEKNELGEWKDIFGNKGIFDHKYDKEAYFYGYGSPQGKVVLRGLYSGSLIPNISISEDRMTVSWNPVIKYDKPYSGETTTLRGSYGWVTEEDRNSRTYISGAVENKQTGEM